MKAVQTAGTNAVEVVEVGAEVDDLKTGDRVVVNPQSGTSGLIGCGGTQGGRRSEQGANALGQPRPATDVYIDAAGVPAVINTTVANAKWGAKLVMVAVQKPSDKIDLGGMLRSELTLIASQGYPTEIFEVTPQLVEHQDRFAKIINHRVPYAQVDHAFELALTPGAADKVVVMLDDQD